jgi:hypothetical protein
VQVGPDGCVRLVDPPNIVIDLVHQQFFPDPTDTDVTMSQNPQDDVIFVSRNGIVQSELNGDYFRLDDVITFSDPFVADEDVIVCWSPIVTAPGIPAHEEFSPTPATDSVTMSHEALRFSNVSRNGIVQRAGPLSGPTTDYTVFGNSLVFSTPFVAAERVVVGYSILPLTFGRPDHYETSPAAGATVVTLPKVAASVLIVARNGVTEAITGGTLHLGRLRPDVLYAIRSRRDCSSRLRINPHPWDQCGQHQLPGQGLAAPRPRPHGAAQHPPASGECHE